MPWVERKVRRLPPVRRAPGFASAGAIKRERAFSDTRSEIQTRLARPVKDPLALDETLRLQLIQFVFDTLSRPHAQLLPKQSPRDSILFTDRDNLEYGLRNGHSKSVLNRTLRRSGSLGAKQWRKVVSNCPLAQLD